MLGIRKIVKDIVDTIPDEKLKEVLDTIEGLIEMDIDEAWLTWAEFGKDAGEGKWQDASEKHDFYLYGIKG